MLKKADRPTELPVTLAIKGQGVEKKLNVTYFNRNDSEIDAFVKTNKPLAAFVMYLVKSIETEYELSEDGLREMEGDWPGITDALMAGFSTARRMAVVKN